jgi:hypothetical protein
MDHVTAPQARVIAGVAKGDITPPVGMYHRMWGAALHDRSTGIHRPLVGTVLYLQPRGEAGTGADAVVLVALDHCILERAECDAIRRTAAAAAQTRPEQVHVSLSHTHGAGLMTRSRADLPGGERIGPYLDQMTQIVGRLAGEARAAAKPALLTAAYGRCNLARQRDYYDTDNRIYVCGFNPHATGDDTLLVARLTADDGAVGEPKILGTIVNYACHPTTLAWQNTLVSPDYIGALRETVEAKFAAPCFFMQGSSGDLGPLEGFVGDTAVADRNGRQVGYAALAALDALPPPATKFVYSGPVVSGATLGTWKHEALGEAEATATATFRHRTVAVALPYRADLPTIDETKAEQARWQADEDKARAAGDELKTRDCHAQVERMRRRLLRLQSLPPGKTFPYEFAVMQTGGILWVVLPGELYQLMQRELRRRFPKSALVVATISDDWQPGYFPEQGTYGLGIYQEEIAIVAPGSLETLVERVAAELETLQRA